MPPLPPVLYQEIVNALAPHFEDERERRARLLVQLSQWPGWGNILWTGSRDAFVKELVYQLPPQQLQVVLKTVLTGYEGEQHSEDLCQRVEQAALILGSDTGDPLAGWIRKSITKLSGPRSAVDQRFVQLSLLVDKGEETPGIRFVPDSRRGRFDNLADLSADIDSRVIVLLGQPGSGKTTLLRRLQLEEAWRESAQPDGRAPFFISLNFYEGSPPPEPADWLAQQWREQAPDLGPFEQYFTAGKILLLLDGLNEMPHLDRADYRLRILRWRAFLQQAVHYDNTILFSCRTLDYSAPLSSEAVPVPQVQVEPLSPAQIERFLQLYLGQQAEAVWQVLRLDGRQLALFATPFFLELLVEQIANSGEMPAGRTALLTGFVRRALHREAIQRLQPLLQPDSLLSENDYEQIHLSDWQSPWELPGHGELIPRLERLAYQMQAGLESDDGGQVRASQDRAVELLDHHCAADIITAGIRLNILDRERRTITYFHQLIQEYFAARVLAKRPEPGRVAVAWQAAEVQPSLADWLEAAAVSDPLPPAPATGWEETTLLAAAMTADQEQFVTDLMAANLPLAARCAAAPDVTVPPTLVARLQAALLTRIADPEADLRARIAAAEALGELGDPRFEPHTGPHGEYILPPVVAIPAGTYTIGADDSPFDWERPAHSVQIEAFEIGVFPVTNAEYALFMAAGGYKDERWWRTGTARAWLRGESGSEGIKQGARELQIYLQEYSDETIRQRKASPEQIEAWLWFKYASAEELERQYEEWYPFGEVYRQPRFWDDSRFNHPSRPVVGVTWFEVCAYCAWLSAQTGVSYRLPTEVEWEAAARGQGQREYAYGSIYDAVCCNTFETHIRRTTPVGVFPNGRTSEEGIYDLSGNVWEWTSTIWGKSRNNLDYPYPYDERDGREDPDAGASWRILRGGSWYNVADEARAVYRRCLVLGRRHYHHGFRLVVRRSCARNGLLSQ